MNVYELEMSAVCPVDPTVRDEYAVTIECYRMLQVEHINATVDHLSMSPIFQEALTAELQARTGGRVTVVGVHSGVTVTSTIGEP